MFKHIKVGYLFFRYEFYNFSIVIINLWLFIILLFPVYFIEKFKFQYTNLLNLTIALFNIYLMKMKYKNFKQYYVSKAKFALETGYSWEDYIRRELELGKTQAREVNYKKNLKYLKNTKSGGLIDKMRELELEKQKWGTKRALPIGKPPQNRAMAQNLSTFWREGYGFSQNGERAYLRGEKPKFLFPPNINLIPTIPHHITCKYAYGPNGFKRSLTMFYRIEGTVLKQINGRHIWMRES